MRRSVIHGTCATTPNCVADHERHRVKALFIWSRARGLPQTAGPGLDAGPREAYFASTRGGRDQPPGQFWPQLETRLKACLFK